MNVVVVIPTYNEAGNIAQVLRRLRDAAPAADLLVVDEASPDGTAEIVRASAAELGGIDVLHRPGKLGLGSAYRDAFIEALRRGYQVLVAMGGDLSHDAASLPALLGAVERGADLAVGSRYVPGGSIPRWSIPRRALSRWAVARPPAGRDAQDRAAGRRADCPVNAGACPAREGGPEVPRGRNDGRTGLRGVDTLAVSMENH